MPLRAPKALSTLVAVDRAAGAVSTLLAVVSAVAVFVAMVGIAADVINRYFAGRSIPGMVESVEVLIVVMVFGGLGAAQRKGLHVGVNVVLARLNPNVRNTVQTVALLFAAVLLAWIVYRSGLVAWDSWLKREYRFGLVRVPVWPARIMIPIGLGMLVIEIILTPVRATLRRGAGPVTHN